MTLITFLINQLFRNFTGQLILTPLTSRSCLNYSCWNLAGTFRMPGLYRDFTRILIPSDRSLKQSNFKLLCQQDMAGLWTWHEKTENNCTIIFDTICNSNSKYDRTLWLVQTKTKEDTKQLTVVAKLRKNYRLWWRNIFRSITGAVSRKSKIKC